MNREYEEVARSLTNQPPISDVVVEQFEGIRVNAKRYAKDIVEMVPNGREKSIALTKLEESVMWAIKGIALNQDDIDPEAAGWDTGEVNTEKVND